MVATRTDILSRLADEMIPYLVGPIPVKGFLDHFLPKDGSSTPTFKKGMFKELIPLIESATEPEKKLYDPFVSPDPTSPTAAAPDLRPNHTFPESNHALILENTSMASDHTRYNKFPFALKPDCSVYAKGNRRTQSKLDLSCVDFVIMFKKRPHCDPFIGNPFNIRKINPFVSPNSSAREVLGQLTAYAAAILSGQYRTPHTFMVFIVNDYARLIRWDCSGALVTGEPIRFNKEPHLFEFLSAMISHYPKVRGHDSTVSSHTNLEIARAISTIPEFKKGDTFLAIRHTSNRYIIHAPECRPDLPVGRRTRSSLAYDVQNRCRVLLEGFLACLTGRH